MDPDDLLASARTQTRTAPVFQEWIFMILWGIVTFRADEFEEDIFWGIGNMKI
jgi:hypothetical protein